MMLVVDDVNFFSLVGGIFHGCVGEIPNFYMAANAINPLSYTY
jgi:hypothetical protein